MVLRKMDQQGITGVSCCRKANVDRDFFCQLSSDIRCKPSKPIAAAFAIALELSLKETQAMLRSAGFAFSHASKFDIILEYFITRQNYNIFEINEALFAFGQSPLGG